MLTFILDTVGKNCGFTIYDGNKNDLFFGNIFSDLSFKTLIGNLLMLQGVFTRVWGSNGPLWSIMYEWWFYILYIPLFYINIKDPIKTAYVVLVSFAIVSIASAHLPSIVVKFTSYFFIWYLGAFVADIYMKRINLGIYIYMLFLFILLTVSLVCAFHLNIFQKDILISLLFCAIIYCSVVFYEKLEVFNKISFLSGFSYTLYVIHIPILVFVSGYILKNNNNRLPMNFTYLFSSIFFTVLSAWLIHFVVEKPFTKK